jgi:hypothetical protein
MKRTPPPRSTVSQYQISRSCRWYRLSALRASVIPIPSRLRSHGAWRRFGDPQSALAEKAVFHIRAPFMHLRN